MSETVMIVDEPESRIRCLYTEYNECQEFQEIKREAGLAFWEAFLPSHLDCAA